MNRKNINTIIENADANTNTFIEANKKGDRGYLYDDRLTPTEKTCYGIIDSACYGDKIECFPSQATLAKAINRSVRTVQRCIKKLKELGYISVRRRGSISNLYINLCKKLKQAGQKVTDAVKKAHNAFKGAKKASNWDIEHRKYDFDKLESALLGQGNFEYEELLE